MTQTPQNPPAAAQALFGRVEQATQDSAYAVTPTEKGFDITIDIVDAKWWGVLNRAGLKKYFIHHVAVPDSQTFLITDEDVEVSWSAGVPTSHYSQSRTLGRTYKKSFGVAYAFDDNFRPGEVYRFSFDSEESRHLVKAAAKSLGMTEKMPATMKIGLFTAVGTIAAMIVVGVVLLIVFAVA